MTMGEQHMNENIQTDYAAQEMAVKLVRGLFIEREKYDTYQRGDLEWHLRKAIQYLPEIATAINARPVIFAKKQARAHRV